jgi:predicted esterase
MLLTGLSFLLFSCTSLGDKETGEDGEQQAWRSAELTELTSGECPNMSTTGDTVTFLSSNEERTVTILFPETPSPGMRIVYFYHGLLNVGSNPTASMAQALDFQSMANEHNAVIILPQSPIWELPLIGQFHMWDAVEGQYDKDVAFFDDLRTCVASEFDVDLDKLVISGFSGGSLFLTVLLSQRSDTLAAVAEMSGGAEIELGILVEDTIAPYSSPTSNVPVLLISGGDNDLWPDPSYTLVQFDESSDTLQQLLLADDLFVVRCRHNAGHTITQKAYSTSVDWLLNHEYGVESPYISDIGSWADWCEIPE